MSTRKTAPKTTELDNLLEAIARKHGVETLKTRNSGSLDFYDMAVWTMKDMMTEAYKAGEAGLKAGQKKS